jgi:alpha-L-arabinofuranosidase
MDKFIADNRTIMDKYDPEGKVSILVDEWGTWYAPTEGTNPGFLQQQNSQRDAVLAALNFNIFIRHAERVKGANIAQMINVLQAMILTEGEKMVLTPTYHAFRMYVPFQDATRLPINFNKGIYKEGAIELPRVDAIAAKGKRWQNLCGHHQYRPQKHRFVRSLVWRASFCKCKRRNPFCFGH